MVATQRISLTARDRQILAFVADHQFVLERQVAALVDRPVEGLRDRLRSLAADRYIDRAAVFGELCCIIRRRGLDAVGSRLRAPRLKTLSYQHEIGTAWLWLAARAGAFGPVAEVLAERRLRSHDLCAPAPQEPYAVRLGGHDANGRERRHYPDLLLIDPHGRRLALELELTPKGITRRETILAGYGADRRLDGVVYLVEDSSEGRAIGRAVKATAARMRLLDRVDVRLVTPIRGPGHSRAHGRSRSRAATVEPGR